MCSIRRDCRLKARRYVNLRREEIVVVRWVHRKNLMRTHCGSWVMKTVLQMAIDVYE
jgi:hypothetical protein